MTDQSISGLNCLPRKLKQKKKVFHEKTKANHHKINRKVLHIRHPEQENREGDNWVIVPNVNESNRAITD